MKKSMFLSVVAAFAIVGCAKNEIDAPVSELGFEPEDVVASFDEATKTSLATTGDVLWSSDDAITVLYKGTVYAMSYKVKEGVGSALATFGYNKSFFATGCSTFDKFYGIYPEIPADSVPMVDGKFQVAIPATQSYAVASFDKSAAVMTGSSATTDIAFKNATGLLKIFLTPVDGPIPPIFKVNSIVLTSENHLLAGNAYIGESSAAVIKEEGGVKTVTLVCGEDGVALDQSETFKTYEGKAFIFALPATTFENEDLTITVNLTEGDTPRTIVKKLSAGEQGFKVERSKIATVPFGYGLEDITGGIEAEAQGIANLNDMLDNGQTSVVLTSANDAHNTNVIFPKAAEDKDVTIKITGEIASQTGGEYSGKKVIFFENADHAEGNDGPATLVVSAPAGTVLVFDTPLSHVTINGTSYELISGRFDVNTLVIPEGVTVKKLVMKKGSASILGTVEAIEIAEQGADEVFFKECRNLSNAIYQLILGHVHSDYAAEQNGELWNIVERPTAAKIGDVEYKSLAEAVAAATAGQTVTLADDVEITEKIILAKSIILDLNGHVITNKVNQARTFEFAGPDIDFTIDGTKAGSGMTIPEGWDNRNGSQKSWGFIRTNYAGCNITLNGGTYTGKTQNGSFITTRYAGFTEANWDDESTWSNVTLNNVSMNTNLHALDLHCVNRLTVNGGEFVVTGGEDNAGTPVSVAFTIEEAQDGIFNGVNCNSPVANIEIISGKIKFVDCDFTAIAGWSGSVDATNIGVSYGGHAIVESGSYKITDPNNLGTKTGGSLFVYSSGGTIEANGGTFVGVDHVIKIGFDRGTFGKYYDEGEVPSNIIVKGGSFTGTFNKYHGSDADNNINISGGTFNVNPSAYLDDKHVATESAGVWTVIAVDLAIRTKAQLIAFEQAVNAGNTYSGKTVVLAADINLAGVEWKPIGNVTSYPGITFAGTFDGMGHTISNMTTSDNLADYATAAFFGSSNGTIKNLNLTNVNVTSTHYAAAICGYTSNELKIENCSVVGGTITSTPELIGGSYDNGDKVGGILGYGTADAEIDGCSVSDITITAYRDLGGIAGCTGGKVTNCSVTNSTIRQDNTNGYKSSVTTYDAIVGRNTGSYDYSISNTASGCTVESVN